MHRTASEGAALARAIRGGLEGRDLGVDALVAPPFTALHAVGAELKGSAIALSAQNMHPEKEGAFTGEISPLMLKEAGCTHVILGHSERRTMFHETDAAVASKARSALAHGLVPIVCVGETLEERDASRTLEVVEGQLRSSLAGLGASDLARIVLAYEPVWAIGTGRAATPEQAQEVHDFLRRFVESTYGAAHATTMRILYGGSVKPENTKALMAQPDIDGALVGGACLVAESFLRIIEAAR